VGVRRAIGCQLAQGEVEQRPSMDGSQVAGFGIRLEYLERRMVLVDREERTHPVEEHRTHPVVVTGIRLGDHTHSMERCIAAAAELGAWARCCWSMGVARTVHERGARHTDRMWFGQAVRHKDRKTFEREHHRGRTKVREERRMVRCSTRWRHKVQT
jgi:hypothetical protein